VPIGSTNSYVPIGRITTPCSIDPVYVRTRGSLGHICHSHWNVLCSHIHGAPISSRCSDKGTDIVVHIFMHVCHLPTHSCRRRKADACNLVIEVVT
jgi:hypothetical protein